MNPNAALLDTVGLLALWNDRDQWHESAFGAHSRLRAGRTPFFTTTYILLELGNATARWPFRDELLQLKLLLERNNWIVHPTAADWREAWGAYERRENASAGIVDQTSIVVMRRLGITRVFGNDRHFRAAGFETLF